MTFLKYFAAKEELLKNADESLQKRIQSKSSTLEYEVKDQDEIENDTHDDFIKGTELDAIDGTVANASNIGPNSVYHLTGLFLPKRDFWFRMTFTHLEKFAIQIIISISTQFIRV